MNAHRVVGPPGTGKTTRLWWLMRQAAQKYGPENVMVLSLTKSAAQNIAEKRVKGEALLIPRQNIGTLHSFAYRSLENPRLADTREGLAAWNGHMESSGQPHFKVSMEAFDLDDSAVETPYAQSTQGDQALAQYNIARSKLHDPNGLPVWVQSFVRNWEAWKSDEGMMDFIDLLTYAKRDVKTAPGSPKVLLVDEAQDTPRLGAELAWQWAESTEHFCMVGDPMQNLFEWAGTDLEAFTDRELPERHNEVLSQSYRVPAAVHRFATEWVRPFQKKVEAQLKREILYHPRREQIGVDDSGDPVYGERYVEGEVRRCAATWKLPDLAVREAQEYVEQGKSVMFLAACSHMLEPLLFKLRERGLPFHNPYRQKRGDWNPLASGKGTSATDRLTAYLRADSRLWGAEGARYWNPHELHLWVQLVEAKGLLRHGAKGEIEELAKRVQQQGGDVFASGIPLHVLTSWFTDLDGLLDVMGWIDGHETDALTWLRQRLLPTRRKAMEFPLLIAEQRGVEKLREPPRIIVGTIHCSPGDEPVLTTDGYVPIEELNPETHRLASYQSSCNRLSWGARDRSSYLSRKGQGHEFKKAKNHYSGRLYTFTTARSRTRVTPDHRMRVRWSRRFYDKWAVYLMRRGDWWRIGLCQTATRPYKCGTLHSRMSTEKADCGWILGIFENRHDAVVEETRLQAIYGIPSLTFFSDEKTRLLSNDDIRYVYESSKSAIQGRVERLFADRGLKIDAPLYKRNGEGRDHARSEIAFETIAANVIPGYMEVPVADENFHLTQWVRGSSYARPDWLEVSVEVEEFSGDVFSLSVNPYEFYVSGGTVVHNSLKGAESEVCYVFPDLSRAAMLNWVKPGPEKEGIRRAFYVAFTRASETLVLCGRATQWSV